MFGSAGHANAQATHVPHLALTYFARRAARHFNPIVQSGFDNKTFQLDMRCVSKRDKRGVQRRQRDLCPLQIVRRPDVKTARSAVDDKLARFINLLQHVQGTVSARRRIACMRL